MCCQEEVITYFSYITLGVGGVSVTPTHAHVRSYTDRSVGEGGPLLILLMQLISYFSGGRPSVTVRLDMTPSSAWLKAVGNDFCSNLLELTAPY